MIRYTCPCSNVTIEAAEDASPTDNQQNLEKVQTFLDTNENTAETKEVLASFLACESYIQTKRLNSKNELDSFDSHLNAKYPLLIGTASKKYEENSTLLKVNKCLICDALTHIEFVQESAVTAADSQQSDTTKKSVLENRHFSDRTSSHSAPNTISKNLNTSTIYYHSLLINSKLMILHYDNDKLTSSDSYSSVYDILVDDKKATVISSEAFGDLKLKINEVPIFEQRRFLNQINEKYTLSHTTSTKEEVLKQKFENLVNCLLNNESTNTSSANSNNAGQNQSSTASSGIQLANRIQPPNSEQRKARRKNDENLLSSSVFGMEEIDESEDEGKFLSDRDSQDEDEDANQSEHGQKSVLKKRNSNIRDSDTGSAIAATKNIISRQQSFPHKAQVANQYSCSLPRDIPVMTVRQSMARTYHKDYDGSNNENYFNPSKEQQNPAQMVSGSYKQPTAFQNYNFSMSNDDDDIFEDDATSNQQENFDIDEEDTRNMGQAISTLAMSIVVKDGRELFGGVPSRRVPINSISKSCYE